jgi:hypothetical protein
MDKGQKDSFAKTYGHRINDKIEINGILLTRKDFTLENPKISIWITAQEIVACIHADYSIHSEIEKIKTKYWNALVEKFN